MTAPLSLWKTYTAAPHRVMFLGGVVQLIAVVLWWTVELVARYAGIGTPFSTPVFSTWAHAWFMLFGLFPFFMFGFLMTTYPRWMGGPLVAEWSYVGGFLSQAAGIILFYVGLASVKSVLIIGVALHIAGFTVSALGLWQVYRKCRGAKRLYETHLNVAIALGILAEAAFLLWLMSNQPLLLQISLRGAVWLFLVPVLALVGHRMIPFFSSSALRDYKVVQPRWTFPLVWIGVVTHFFLETMGEVQWLFIADGLLLVATIHHTLHWGFLRSLSNRLLGALHLSFAFLSVGLLLSVIQSLWLLFTDEMILGRAPLHAIGIGFIGGMVVAMVTRVSRGHSGRPVVMEPRDWYSFLGILLAASLRILGDVASLPSSLNLVAALVWLVVLAPWVAYYLPMYWRPRADGQEG